MAENETGNVPAQSTPENGQTVPQTPVQDDGMAGKLLAGKFKAVPDLEKSYKDLQAELNRKTEELAKFKTAKPEAEAPTATEPDKAKQTEPKAQSQEQKARLGESLMAEYLQHGKLSDAAKAKASDDLGLPPAVIAQFETYLNAQREAGLKKISETFKDLGEFSVDDVVAEMNKTVSPEKLQAIQTLVDAGDIAVLRPYVEAHVKSKLPAGQTGKATSTNGAFADRKAYAKAINDKRYDQDRSYRAKVMADIAATDPARIAAWDAGIDA